MSVILTNFVPKRREISAVTNAVRAVVTTTEDHDYFIGQFVSLIVPLEYGMDLRFIQAKILSIPTTTSFETDVDTSQMLTYVTPTFPPAFTQSHCVPISGEGDNATSITG